MSIRIEFEDIVKKYGENTVIPKLSLSIQPSEFFTLLGPSGCGKTTLLRMVAGFNSIEGGTIRFNEKIINDLAPKNRNIGMVFQNYAIFPNLTVEKNVSFGLDNRKLAKDQIAQKVDEILDVVQISDFKKRLPENLSGGQQQRIALARAIVIEPDVLLMDEPLSNLDAKLRVDMRNAIKDIQKKVGITTVYVTHDQEEAMAVSDRIAVMNKGSIEHVGTPQNIYHRPSNIFVASFIGRANFIKRKIKKNQAGELDVIFSENYSLVMDNLLIDEEQEVIISIRPEEFIICEGSEGMTGTIETNMFLGINTHYFVRLDDGEEVEIIKESTLDKILPEGTKVVLQVNQSKINVFDKETERSVTKGVVNDGATP